MGIRPSSIHRRDIQATVLGLIDLGFTPMVVAWVLKKNPVSIYLHLKRAGRAPGKRTILRQPPTFVSAHVMSIAQRIFSEAEWVIPHMMATAQQSAGMSLASTAKPPASATKRGSKASAKKVASSAKARRKPTT